jgi:basic amino acid/polyamine antiporter, APA family
MSAGPTSGTSDEPAKLRRALGTPSLTFFGVGMILGAGIYAVIGSAAGEAGGMLWLSFAIASVVALLTGLSYAELSAMYPRAGVEFVFLREAAPRWPAPALATALLVALSGLATCATVALAFADYLGGLVGWEETSAVLAPQRLAALGLLGASFAVAAAGIRQSSWVNVVFTLIEASGLVLVIVLGIGSGRWGQAALETPGFGVLAGAGLVFFSFLGFENVATLSEEAKEPERMVPRAVVISILVSGALYVMVAFAAVALLPPAQLAASSTPLTSAVEGASPTAGTALSVIALFATANTCLASLVVTSRLLYGVADGGALPAWLARTSRTKTPHLALATGLAIAASLTFLGEVPLVASLSSLASLCAFFAVNTALVVLRLRAPERERPFRVPLSVGNVPIPSVLGALATLGLVAAIDRTAQFAGAIAVAIVGVIAWLGTRRMRPAPEGVGGRG